MIQVASVRLSACRDRPYRVLYSPRMFQQLHLDEGERRLDAAWQRACMNAWMRDGEPACLRDLLAEWRLGGRASRSHAQNEPCMAQSPGKFT